MPKHRAAPVPTQPDALSGPRHVGEKRRTARKALRGTVTLTGLAAAATGVAVATGVVQSPGSAVNLADSLSPSASNDNPNTPSADVQDRSAIVSRSADRDTMALRSWTSAEGVFGLSFDALGERESARFTADPGDWTTPVATATPVAAAARPVRVTVPRSALRAVRRFSPT